MQSEDVLSAGRALVYFSLVMPACSECLWIRRLPRMRMLGRPGPLVDSFLCGGESKGLGCRIRQSWLPCHMK